MLPGIKTRPKRSASAGSLLSTRSGTCDGHGHGRHLPVAAGLDSGYPAVKDACMTSETGSVVGIARQEPDLSFRPAFSRLRRDR